MTAPAETELPAVVRRPRRVSRWAVFVVGVIVIPLVLNVSLNSYGALTVDGAVRMAFATVAGQTIAILSAIAIVVLTVKRYAIPSVIATTVIAAVITCTAVSIMAGAGDLLLIRLDNIAEIDQLNR